jgi:hypothetical protein
MKSIRKAIFRIGISALISLSGALLLTGCSYSNYLHMGYEVHHSPVWNPDSTVIAFVLSTRAYLPAKGLSRFPDGGISKYLHKEVALYVYDTRQQQATKVAGFPYLTDLLGSSRSNWDSRLFFDDHQLYFHIAPLMEWQWYLNRADTEEQRERIKKLKQNYQQAFGYRLATSILEPVDTITFQAGYEQPPTSPWATTKKILETMPLSTIGLEVQKIYPKSDKAYIQEALLLKNSSPTTRRAVLEQIIANQSREAINAYIKQIDQQKEKLEGIDKDIYESTIQPLYQQLQSMH